ncbi:MAG: uracil phosphoribosyltransferase [Filifactoraceae bacterium]
MSKLIVMNHPLIDHKVSILRDKNTGTKQFQEIVSEIGGLMAYEMTRDLATEERKIETPLEPMMAKFISGKKLAIVPILRAGLGMVDGILNLIPAAKVGHIGLYRDPVTHEPVEYFCKLPQDLEERMVFVVDPMLATGGSANAAIDLLKARGVKSIKLVCLVGCPEGVEAVQNKHNDVDIYLAALDRGLDEHCYIRPGLGDAGDRIFGTK